MKKIALVTNDPEPSAFKNGSVTQPLMMALAFEQANIPFEMFAQTPSNYFKYTTRPLSELFETRAKGFSHILMVCHIKCFGDSTELQEIVNAGIKLIHVLCGHHAIFTIEDMALVKQNRCADMLRNKYANETWIFAMHEEFSDLYTHWLDTQVKVYPYVWDPCVVQAALSESSLVLAEPQTTPKMPLTIVIAEPNLNVTKSCFLPLIAANSYARAHPERVRRVILLCKPSGPGFDSVMLYMDSISDRIEMHDRLAWPAVASQLLALKDTCPVLLSHHMLNEANFLTLETFYMGIPVVHNSRAFRPGGFFYDGWSVSEAIDALDRVWKGERNTELSKSVAARFAPNQPEITEGFKVLLQN